MAGVVVVATGARPSAPRSRCPLCATPRGFEELPRGDWRPPSGPRACESRRPYAGDRRQSAPNGASSGGVAIRDAIAPRYPAGPARVPCASAAGLSQHDPEQPISPAETRPCTRASQRPELLSKREVFEHQFLMPTTSQGQRSRDQHNHFHDTVDRVLGAVRNQPVRAPDSILARHSISHASLNSYRWQPHCRGLYRAGRGVRSRAETRG